jgi:hypothetical protein
MKKTILTIAIAVLAMPAHAEITAAPAGCVLKENVTVGINFNHKVPSIKEAKVKFDEQTKAIEQFAKQQELKKFEKQSMNYNIYTQMEYNQPTYQLSGSVQYQMDNSEEAFKFAEFLTQQKLQVSVNSNAYRQGNCN